VTSFDLLGTCLSWSFVLMQRYSLIQLTKILMRAISNVHVGRRFPTPALDEQWQLTAAGDPCIFTYSGTQTRA